MPLYPADTSSAGWFPPVAGWTAHPVGPAGGAGEAFPGATSEDPRSSLPVGGGRPSLFRPGRPFPAIPGTFRVCSMGECFGVRFRVGRERFRMGNAGWLARRAPGSSLTGDGKNCPPISCVRSYSRFVSGMTSISRPRSIRFRVSHEMPGVNGLRPLAETFSAGLATGHRQVFVRRLTPYSGEVRLRSTFSRMSDAAMIRIVCRAASRTRRFPERRR